MPAPYTELALTGTPGRRHSFSAKTAAPSDGSLYSTLSCRPWLSSEPRAKAWTEGELTIRPSLNGKPDVRLPRA